MPQLKDIEESSQKKETPRIYQFDDFQIDVVEETLHQKGEKLRINRRTFQVLRLLVERAGQIISKQEFFDTVWADTFVEDNSLTVTMTTLRKILGDDSKQPKFIENLPRKGYRFIGEVKVVNEAPPIVQIKKNDEPSLTETEKRLKHSKNRKISLIIVAGSLVFLLCALDIYYPGFTQVVAPWQKTSQIESIAVLPFENQNPDTEYLSDGLTESVINSLTELPNLRVISRNSVFQYKGKATDSATIGRELNVRAVLTGRFIQRGDDLIINAELTDLRDNKQIWGRQFNQKVTDAFALQHEISRDISETLRSRLTGEEQRRFGKQETDSPEAYQFYLKGQYYWNKRTVIDYEKAAEFFNQAIEKDPTYALAYVGLANCYLLGNFKNIFTRDELAAMANAEAQKALEIDSQLGEAYAVLAINSCYYDWDWANADREYKRAIELSPNYATAHQWYAEFLAMEGRFDESFAEYKRALELDPLSLAIKTDEGFNYYYAHQYDRAADHLQRVKEINPNYERTYWFLAFVYQKKEMYEDSITEYDKFYTLQRNSSQITEARMAVLSARMATLENAFKKLGANGYWQKWLEFTVEDGSPGDVYDDVFMATCYLRLGERDKAFAFLEKAYQKRNGTLVWLKVSPEFDDIRSDPRFADLMRRVGLLQ